MIEIVSYGDGNLFVHLEVNVIDAFSEHVQQDRSKAEACGVLIGSTSLDFKSIRVESITQPLPEDNRGRRFFFLKGKGHQKLVDQMFNKSGGTQRFLGTWHTHPEEIPNPSSADYKGWNILIKKNPDFSQFIFVIVGTSKINVFTKRGKKFIKLLPIDNHEKIPRH